MEISQKLIPQFLEIEERHVAQRLDNFLFTQLKGLPKSRIYRAIRKGEVRVNKKRVKPEYKLQIHDSVRLPPLRGPAPEEKIPTPQGLLKRLEHSIVFEDADFIIINKPAGIAVHGGSGINFGVIEIMRQLRPHQKFLELAHRLDRDTSGCLLLVKKSSVLKEVHALITQREVTKIYWLLVAGECRFTEKKIDLPLTKNTLKSGERIVVTDPEGKAAQTVFRPLRKWKGMTLLEAKLITGRTHQIRVHAAAMGHPIIGDEKYGDDEKNRHFRNMDIKQLCLHALSLQFYLASKEKLIGICCMLQEKWANSL